MGVSWDTPGDGGERGRIRGQRGTFYDKYQGLEKNLRHLPRRSPKQWARLLPFLVRHPRQAASMLFLLYVSQSWNWQFRTTRTAEPPMKHLWQTWDYQEP